MIVDNKISVVIPVYNSEKTIKRCIDSLLIQSFKDFEVLVINDGSTDNTEKIVSNIKDERVKLINQSNLGVSAARNAGIKKSNSTYIAFVDSDDYVDSDYLFNLINGYKDKTIDLSVSGINYVYPSDQYKTSTYQSGKYSSDFILSNILKNDGIKGYLWNKLWKANIIKEHNIYLDTQISMAEDLLFTVKYVLHSSNVYISNHNDYNYVYETNSLSNSISLKNSNPNYKKGFSDYLNVSDKILKLIPVNNYIGKKNAEANIGIICTNYIRRIEKDNYSDNEYLKGQIKKLGKKYVKSTLKGNNILSFQQKLAFLLTMYVPGVMKFLDEIRR